MRPITNPEWGELLRPLPDNANRVAVRQALEPAIREYVDGAAGERQWHEAWKEIARHANSQGVAKFCRAIAVLKLQNFPLDPQVEELLRVASLLMQTHSRAKVVAALYLPTNRRSRFMTAISLIWTNVAKGKLSIYEDSPFVDFLAAIYERVEGRTLDRSGVKKFVGRERARRAFLNSIKLELSASTNMLIDEAKVHVVRPD
jgi:hypothetical protein